MNRYAIYQLSSENPKFRDMFFMESNDVEAISDEYDLVGMVNANSFDQVFNIGNLQHELVEKVGPMRSVSCGDILVDVNTGETVVVARIGFDPIVMKEAV